MRFYEIDLLRFLSALLVVIFHYTYTAHMEGFAPVADFEGLRVYTRYAYMGINFFFLISGFVILMSVADGSARNFIISRIVRLYPAYWVALILTSLTIVFLGAQTFSITWPQFFANITMVNEALGHKPVESAYWTLYIELKFYALVLLVLLCGWLKYAEHIIAVTLVALTIALFLPWAESVNMWVSIFPHWSGYFAAGCILFLLRRDGISPYRLALWGLSYVYIIKQSVLFGDLMSQWFGITFDTLVIALMNTVFFAVMSVTAFAKQHVLRVGWFYYLGVLTYPLYLIHQNIGYMLFNHLHTVIAIEWLVPMTLFLMLIIAYGLFRWVEKPSAPMLKRYLMRVFYRDTSQAVAGDQVKKL